MESSKGLPSDESMRIGELMEKINALEYENKRLRQSVEWGRGKNVPHVNIPQHASLSNSVQMLSNAEIERYSRQLLLSNGFGVDGQKKLLDSSVCIVGAGGIGSTGM